MDWKGSDNHAKKIAFNDPIHRTSVPFFLFPFFLSFVTLPFIQDLIFIKCSTNPSSDSRVSPQDLLISERSDFLEFTHTERLSIWINDKNEWNFSILQYQNTDKSDCVSKIDIVGFNRRISYFCYNKWKKRCINRYKKFEYLISTILK